MRGKGKLAPLLSLLAVSAIMVVDQCCGQPDLDFDVVVFGGTVAGIGAAAGAANNTAYRVALLLNDTNLGGMTAGGLSYIDGPFFPVGGFVANVLTQLAGRTSAPASTLPHIARNVLEGVIQRRPNIQVFNKTFGLSSVKVLGGRIVSLTTRSNLTFSGRTFIDGSYEGDLLRLAGVSWRVGRESAQQFNETSAGRQPYIRDFPTNLSPYLDQSNKTLLPLVQPNDGLEPGQADDKIQSMNFRLCITNVSSNAAPWPKPAGYNAADWELVARWFNTTSLQNLSFYDYFLIMPLRDGKYDLNTADNAHGGRTGPVGTDAVGLQYAYPTADYATRNKIYDAHKSFIQGLLYFLSHDPRIWPGFQQQMNSFGLCKDEFVDNSYWPWALYVRESIRMDGLYVLTQDDVTPANPKKNTSVGLSHWSVDVHGVQRMIALDSTTGSATVVNEGRPPEVPAATAEVPFEALVPKRDQVQNLLVPVCISSTHVAFNTYRLETQYLSLGYASGMAAALALEAGPASSTPFQDLDVAELQRRLQALGHVIHA